MKKDIRLYFYEHGTLRKVYPRKYHFHHSEDEAEKTIDLLMQNNIRQKWKLSQFLIVEYFNAYQSKILKIVQDEQFKI